MQTPKKSPASPFQSSAQKLKQFLEEGSLQGSKVSEQTLSRIEKRDRMYQYANLAKKMNFLFLSKQKTYTRLFLNKVAAFTKLRSLKLKIATEVSTLIVNESMLRYKSYMFNKLLRHRNISRSQEQKRVGGLSILVHAFKQKAREQKLWGLFKLRIIQQKIDIINSPSKMKTPKTNKDNQKEEADEQLSASLISPLQQLVEYNRNDFIQFSLTRLKNPLELEANKIANPREAKGSRLLLVVLNNHIKAIIDLKELSKANGNGNNLTIKRSFTEKNSIVVYQQLGAEFAEGDQQLSKLIVQNSQIPKALGAIELAIKNYSSRNSNRYKNNKIVQSRVRLLEIIMAILQASQVSSTSATEVLALPQLRDKKTSYHELEVSHVRLIVQELDQKVYELSTISEQIPQLQTFKRTLDLTMPQHNVYLTKIVDVLIELHHKINKLISRRPEKLLKQIEAVEQQCLIIEIATTQFLQKVASQSDARLKPIYFDQRNNKSPDYFRKIQKNVVKMSEVMIECMDLQAQAHEKMQQVKSLIEIFWNLIAGMEQFEKEWKMYKNKQNKTDEQQQILQMLQLCLNFVNDRFQKLHQEFDHERQQLMEANNENIQYLETEINKISAELEDSRGVIEQLQRDKQQLLKNLKDFENRLRDISKKTEVDSSDTGSKIAAFEKREKNYKDRIEELEKENEQKKNMISTLTNDMKRVMKQSETSWKADQRNKDLEDTIEKLNSKIESLQTEIKGYKQDCQELKLEKVQAQKNNNLLIGKLSDANRKIRDLEDEIQRINRNFQRERTKFKQELDEFAAKQKKVTSDLTLTTESKLKQLERKENDYKFTIQKKDQKISELNDKILDLNNKLNELLNNYKNAEFQLKRKEITEKDLNARIRSFEQNTSNQFQLLSRNYEKNQQDLTNALAEIQRCKNRIVPDLQAEIKRREAIIAKMQIIIKQLQEKQAAILDQEKNYLNLRQYADGIEDALKKRDLKIKELDVLIADLQNQLKIANDTKTSVSKSEGQLKSDINDRDNKIRALEGKIAEADRNAKRLGELEEKNRRAEQDLRRLSELEEKNRKMQADLRRLNELEEKNRRMQADLRRLGELQNKNRSMQADLRRLSEIETKLNQSQHNNSRAQQLEAKLNLLRNIEIEFARYRESSEAKVRGLQNQLNEFRNKSRTTSNIQNELRNAKIQSERVPGLESQLRAARDEINRLRRVQVESSSSNNKISGLEATLAERNKRIYELQARIRTLESQLSILQREIAKSKNLMDELRNKDREIMILLQEKNALESQQGPAAKVNDYLKQIQYLKQKIRSLEDLIDIFTEQHKIIEAKVREYQAKQATWRQQADQFNRLTQDYTSLSSNFRAKQQQLIIITQRYQQLRRTPQSPISMIDNSASKLQKTEREAQELAERIMMMERSFQQQFNKWSQRQRELIGEISRIKTQLQMTKFQLTTLQSSQSTANTSSTVNGSGVKGSNEYYLRVEGEKLEDLIKRMENGSRNLNMKLDEILNNSRRSDGATSSSDIELIKQHNRFLVAEIQKMLGDNRQMSSLVKQFPTPEFVTEYAFRIIIYFSEILPESPEGRCVWDELLRIRHQYKGQRYFIVLQQFTKYTLQQNAIQVYRRMLKDKAHELEALKAKFDMLFDKQIHSEKKTYEKTALTQSRVMMFRQKLMSSNKHIPTV